MRKRFQKTTKRQQRKEQLLTISQAANALGVHPDTLRNWGKRRILVPIRIGNGENKQRRYSMAQINGMKYIMGRNSIDQQESQGRTGFFRRLFGR